MILNQIMGVSVKLFCWLCWRSWKSTDRITLWSAFITKFAAYFTCILLKTSLEYYSWVMNSHMMLILLTAACHLERREISDKLLIYYKIPHTRSGWHDKTHDCRISNRRQLFLLFYEGNRKNSFYSQKSVRIFFFLWRGSLIFRSDDSGGVSVDCFSGSGFSVGGW